MRSNEKEQVLGPGTLMENALSSRPPIPADTADISEIVALGQNLEATEAGWSWTRLPLWLAEIESTYENIGNNPILALDVCSSIPIYTQRLRFLEFERDGARARDLVSELFSSEATTILANKFPHLKPVNHVLGRHKVLDDIQIGRRMLEASIQESLYEITIDEAAETNYENDRYRTRLKEKLLNNSHGYTHKDEVNASEEDKHKGQRVNTIKYDQSYLEYLAELQIPDDSIESRTAREKLSKGKGDKADKYLASQKKPIGLELAQEYIEWQTNFIADRVVGKMRYRPARFFSMDLADPTNIALSAISNMPESAVALDGFSHTIASMFDPLQHLNRSIFEPLPFSDNSLALITSFDGWPFHFQKDPELHGDVDFGVVVQQILHHWYQKLAHGGKIVIFPWAINSESYSTRKGGEVSLTNIVAQFGADVDEKFRLEGYHKETLLKYMSTADRETSERMSPIFNSPNDYFFALVISKSKKRSLEALRAQKHYNLGKYAATTQVQD